MIAHLLRRFLAIAIVFIALASGSIALAQDTKITVVSWNVESGGSVPQTIAQRIRDFQDIDIWGFSEVQNDAAAAIFETAAEDGENADYERIVGTTGGGDRLVIIYDTTRFEKISHQELDNINPGGRVRSPLVAHFRNKATGQEFLFMVNHLYRSRAAERHQQATLLNQWAASQQLPVIAVGDYNFDWSVEDGDQDHDRGYDNMVKDGIFTWVRPATLVRSQCSDTFDSILDFVFTSLPALGWQKTSEIVVVSGDCPDDNTTSDHRPIRAILDMRASEPPVDTPTKQQILDRIEALEAELQRLKELVRRLP